MSTTAFTAVSLFSGCGGSDLGLRAAGIEPIWANEINESACQLFERVTQFDTMHPGDIRKIFKFPKADIVAGCNPCQGYSQGGRRNNEAGINFLYREFDRVLRIVRPKAEVDPENWTRNVEQVGTSFCDSRLAI